MIDRRHLLAMTGFGIAARLALPAAASAQDDATAEPAVDADGNPIASPMPIESDSVATEVERVLAGQPGIYGTLVIGPDRVTDFSRNTDTPFVAASLFKLVLAADIYDGAAAGSVGFRDELPLLEEFFPTEDWAEDGYYSADSAGGTTTVQEALFGILAYSSNVAAKALMTLTDPETLRAMAESLGMSSTWFYTHPWEIAGWPPARSIDAPGSDYEDALAFLDEQAAEDTVMITTPRDIATYFLRLLDGAVVNPQASEAIITQLAQSVIVDRIPLFLPPGTRTAHKTGNLPYVNHDAGVIWTDRGPVIVVSMAEQYVDGNEVNRISAQVALIGYELA